MNKKEMIEELEAAGMSISDDTSEEQIEELYMELQVEQASGDRELAQAEARPTVCPITPNPRFGDKDPDVIAWYKANDRDEYERRYAGRVIPTV